LVQERVKSNRLASSLATSEEAKRMLASDAIQLQTKLAHVQEQVTLNPPV
jgi:hypothetical protein